MPVGSHASSSPIISTCIGAAPPSLNPPETRENIVTCQLLNCCQINFLQKGVSLYLLVPVYRQKCRSRYICWSRYRYDRDRYPERYCHRLALLRDAGRWGAMRTPRRLQAASSRNDPTIQTGKRRNQSSIHKSLLAYIDHEQTLGFDH